MRGNEEGVAPTAESHLATKTHAPWLPAETRLGLTRRHRAGKPVSRGRRCQATAGPGEQWGPRHLGLPPRSEASGPGRRLRNPRASEGPGHEVPLQRGDTRGPRPEPPVPTRPVPARPPARSTWAGSVGPGDGGPACRPRLRAPSPACRPRLRALSPPAHQGV